jgi:TM2 domain-containing membrane protein YozV
VVPSIFGGFGEASSTPAQPVVEVPQVPKSRTTYIVLGALLGAFGAHSFYAGYRTKGVIQLAITVLTLGFGGPMSWMWAVIDICTIHQDKSGVQFEA